MYLLQLETQVRQGKTCPSVAQISPVVPKNQRRQKRFQKGRKERKEKINDESANRQDTDILKFFTVYKHVCMYIWVGGWMDIYICMYVCMYVCVCVCVFFPSMHLLNCT